jgi:hypothetical protein
LPLPSLNDTILCFLWKPFGSSTMLGFMINLQLIFVYGVRVRFKILLLYGYLVALEPFVKKLSFPYGISLVKNQLTLHVGLVFILPILLPKL